MPEPMWPDDRIASLASWSVIRTSLLVVPRLGRTRAPTGLTPTQFGVLVQLDNDPGITASALARRCLMSPQSMAELLPVLETAGYVARDPGGGRGRPIPVRLTPAAHAVLARATPLVERADGLGLDPEEHATLTRLLHKVASHAEVSGS